jgi:hypothetical protein
MNRRTLLEVAKFMGVVLGTAFLIMFLAFLYYAEAGG